MSGFFRELFSVRLYKNSQGRIVRRSTMIAIIVIIAWGAYRFILSGAAAWLFGKIAFLFPGHSGDFLIKNLWPMNMAAGLMLVLGIWLAFRIVNMPGIADFLIAVEAEMNKVSWPTSKELQVTTIVVITVMFIFCIFLFVYDFVWQWLFKWMGVL